jgi:hypothetical protein
MSRRPDPDWDIVVICEISTRATIIRECSTAALRRFIKVYPLFEETWSRGDDLRIARLRTLLDDVRSEVTSRGRLARILRTPRPPKTKNYDL